MARRLWLCGAVALSVGLLVMGWAVLQVAGDGAAAANCGISSVCDLASLLARPVADSARAEMQRVYDGPQVSLLDVRDMAGAVGLDLVGVRASLDELAVGGHCPAIIHLQDPDHFAVLARLSPDWVQLIDRGVPRARPREALAKRYTGHALVLRQPVRAAPGPLLGLPAFHSVFRVTGAGQKVKCDFVCENRGDRDLLLETRVPGG